VLVDRRPGQVFGECSRLLEARTNPSFSVVNDERDDSRAESTFNSADPPRNFSLSVNDRIRAITIGAPAYATRKKSIEDHIERNLKTLVALHDKRVAAGHDGSDSATTRALLEKAATFNIARLNELITSHNLYYPIEASLPTDVRTGEYLVYGRPWRPDEPWTASRFVEEARRLIDMR
jgi:hypothetical protein